MKQQLRIGLRTFIFVGIAAMAGCLDPDGGETAPDENDSGITTSEAVSALSGTQRVCSWATIRRTKGGQVFGFLLPGDNFHIDRCISTNPSSWCYGHAYGHVHDDGWIQVTHLLGC